MRLGSALTVLFTFFFSTHAQPVPVSVRELSLSTTWGAEDAGLAPASHPQCIAWRLWRLTQEGRRVSFSSRDIDLLSARRSLVSIYNQPDAERYRIPLALLQQYTVIHVDFESICQLQPRVLWLNSTAQVAAINMRTDSLCDALDRILSNSTSSPLTGNATAAEIGMGSIPVVSEEIVIESADNTTLVETMKLLAASQAEETENNPLEKYLEEGEIPDTILLNSPRDVDELDLGISPKYFHIHRSIGIRPHHVCENVGRVAGPSNFNKYGKFGEELAAFGYEPSEIRQMIEGGGNLDDMLLLFADGRMSEQRPFPATTLLPFLTRVNYDSRSPPSFYTKEKVLVKTGIHVQSISNFQLTTMDYEMDVWLRMAWRDVRLAHGLSKPILVNDYNFMKKIWRPDPFFANAREAVFHRVTYDNFYVVILPSGDILMEIRASLKNSCPLLVLCKYPHDAQKCGLSISSIGTTSNEMVFEWFSRKQDAVRLNSNLQLPELVLSGIELRECNGARKSGNHSCIEVLFGMQRHVRFHLAQTYVPTTICVLFSMISVWLPEEFVEGRIFVALTVFLTLSAENNSAKEALPKVSYIKAIDYWFGFTSTFVFLTMLQALVVIYLEHSSRRNKKKAEAEMEQSRYLSIMLLLKSRQHHRWARNLDSLCKVMYPVSFLIFLMIYGFVITQGPEDKCLRKVFK